VYARKMADQADEEKDDGPQARTRTISIRMEADLIETARRVGDVVGMGYQTILKAAARVGLRQFVKAHRIELELPDDLPLPRAPSEDLEYLEDEYVGMPGPDEVILHNAPLPRIRP